MFRDLLAFHSINTSSVRAGKDLLLTSEVMNLCYAGICALLSTIVACVVSVGTVLLKVVVQVFPHEVINLCLET
jgi:hypothetical protein